MNGSIPVRPRRVQWGKFALLLCVFALMAVSCAMLRSGRVPVVTKWGCFEREFKSSTSYPNPLQDVTFTVAFTSPLGETIPVYGFWDGGNTWRVRFSPDQPGHWTYRTSCSVWADAGLQDQTGAFICSAPVGVTRFSRHGPVQVARDHRHVEHADGTPFFWLADSAWNGARLSTPKDWERYVAVRSGQNFSAVQWSVLGQDLKQEFAFTGRDRIAVNPGFFKRLDAKVELLNQAGLLSIITPFRGMDAPAAAELPEDQAALLLRYMIARWGACDVAWLLWPADARPVDNLPGEVVSNAWLRAARAAFASGRHAPVIVFTDNPAEYRREPWANAGGYAAGQNLAPDLGGPALMEEWEKEPVRPVINIVPPCENTETPQGGRRITAEQVRQVAWWSLLATPSAGVSYAAEGVVDWNTAIDRQQTDARGRNLPVWEASLFLPGAQQMSHLAGFFNSIEYWRLFPAQSSLVVQPGAASSGRYIAAARTAARDLGVVYTPEDRTVELTLDALPSSPVIGWVNPRTGEKSAAVAVVGPHSCQFPTPGPGDWVLLIKAGK
jgi:Protein of unknown function (DUF4038)/Domain of unknown function (DUF5060)/Putative collagen-binding domain of a collagenase